MRNTSALGLLLTLCLGLLLFSGCVDVSEDITVRSDLSGRYQLKLSLPENLAAMGDMVPGRRSGGDPQRNFEELKSKLEQEKFVESAQFSSTTEGDSRIYSLDIAARDMRRLGEYFEQQAAEGDGNSPHGLSFRLERLSIGKFHFSRSLQFSAMEGMGMPGGSGAAAENPCAAGAAPSASDTAAGTDARAAGGAAEAPGDLKDRLLDKGRDLLDKGIDQGIEQGKKALGGLGGMLGGLMGEALLGDHYYTVTLHASGVSSPDAQLIDDGKAAQWKIPMADLMNGGSAGRTLEADFSALGISGSMMLLLTLFAMLLFGGLIIGIAVTGARRRRKGGGGSAEPA